MFLGQDTPLILPPRAVPVDPKLGADHQPLGALLGIAMAQEGVCFLSLVPPVQARPAPRWPSIASNEGSLGLGCLLPGLLRVLRAVGGSEKLTLHLNSPPNDLIVFRNI